ncbi:DinB family protein [bacterium]|nr:DinB family protein [bacterium]NUN47060.1 DinB family protein [bacterium]
MISILSSKWSRIEANKTYFVTCVQAMNEHQSHWRPKLDAWHALDVLQHLVLVEEGMVKQLHHREAILHKKTVLPKIIGLPAYWLTFRMGMRVKAPVKSVLPQEVMSLAMCVQRWDAVRDVMKNFLETITSETEGAIYFYHPITGQRTCEQMLDFLYDHLRHHQAQMRRIMHHPKYPA